MARLTDFRDYRLPLPWEEQRTTQTAQAKAMAVTKPVPQQQPMTNMLGTYGNQTGVAQYLQLGQQYLQQAQPQQQQPSGSNSEPGAIGTFDKLLNVFSKVLDNAGSSGGVAGGGVQQMQPFQYHLAPGVHPDITNAAADRQAKAGQIQVQQYAAQQQAQIDQQKVDLYRQNLELDQQRAQREEAMAPLDVAAKLADIGRTSASTESIQQDTQQKELTFPSELSYLKSRAELGKISAEQQTYLDPIMREYELNKLALQQLELDYAGEDAELTAGIKRAQLANAEYTNAFTKATMEGNIAATNETNRYSASLNSLLSQNVGEEGAARLEQYRRTIAESRLAATEATAQLPGAGEKAVKSRDLDIEQKQALVDKYGSDAVGEVMEFHKMFFSGIQGPVSGDKEELGSRLKAAASKANNAAFQAMELELANKYVEYNASAVPDIVKNNPEGADILGYLKGHSADFNETLDAAYQSIATGDAANNPYTKDIFTRLPAMYEKLGMQKHANTARAVNEWMGIGAAKQGEKQGEAPAVQPMSSKLNQSLVSKDLWAPPLPDMNVTNASYKFGAGRDKGGRSHKGMDVYAAEGTDIKAPRDAVVSGVFSNKGNAGNYILLDHDDGTRTAYMHLKDMPGLKRGDRVSAGDVIGQVGKTGNAESTGPHLHFEVHKNGKAVDPSTLSYGMPEMQQEPNIPQLTPIEPPEELPTPTEIGRGVARATARSLTGRMDPINPKDLANPKNMAEVVMYKKDGSEAPKAHHIGAFFFRPLPDRNDDANFEGYRRIATALSGGRMVIDSDGKGGITSAFVLDIANPTEPDHKKYRYVPREITDLDIIDGMIEGTYDFFGMPVEEDNPSASGVAAIEKARADELNRKRDASAFMKSVSNAPGVR